MQINHFFANLYSPKYCLLFSLSAVLFATACAQNIPPETTSEPAPPTNSDTKLIQQEVNESPLHPWVGYYYCGDGLGINATLWIAPTNGFWFQQSGCLGPYATNEGNVIETDGVLALEYDTKNELEGMTMINTNFIPISWGKRSYLIPPGKLDGFSRDINSGREPRSRRFGFHLLRSGDEKITVQGLPNLPASHINLIKKPPAFAVP
ncbi:MAG: hypothetical protein ACO1QB_05380 [Verrucomicrobiales bacterium]